MGDIFYYKSILQIIFNNNVIINAKYIPNGMKYIPAAKVSVAVGFQFGW